MSLPKSQLLKSQGSERGDRPPFKRRCLSHFCTVVTDLLGAMDFVVIWRKKEEDNESKFNWVSQQHCTVQTRQRRQPRDRQGAHTDHF